MFFSPLVLKKDFLNTLKVDRNQTVLQRSEPNSRTTLIDEQSNPWNSLQFQDVMRLQSSLCYHKTLCSKTVRDSLLSYGSYWVHCNRKFFSVNYSYFLQFGPSLNWSTHWYLYFLVSSAYDRLTLPLQLPITSLQLRTWAYPGHYILFRRDKYLVDSR